MFDIDKPSLGDQASEDSVSDNSESQDVLRTSEAEVEYDAIKRIGTKSLICRPHCHVKASNKAVHQELAWYSRRFDCSDFLMILVYFREILGILQALPVFTKLTQHPQKITKNKRPDMAFAARETHFRLHFLMNFARRVRQDEKNASPP